MISRHSISSLLKRLELVRHYEGYQNCSKTDHVSIRSWTTHWNP
ncbi:unnamed protein product [Nezara viridula]|uniref:Uncharacterized protein n=1 Tax=Nezara viridula TaxID=85310 RepID=A0A9P0HBP9_NEZVI|nr:unnamed protein product [Nezara viridula]